MGVSGDGTTLTYEIVLELESCHVNVRSGEEVEVDEARPRVDGGPRSVGTERRSPA